MNWQQLIDKIKEASADFAAGKIISGYRKTLPIQEMFLDILDNFLNGNNLMACPPDQLAALQMACSEFQAACTACKGKLQAGPQAVSLDRWLEIARKIMEIIESFAKP